MNEKSIRAMSRIALDIERESEGRLGAEQALTILLDGAVILGHCSLPYGCPDCGTWARQLLGDEPSATEMN